MLYATGHRKLLVKQRLETSITFRVKMRDEKSILHIVILP
jgi:hypothetical protein